MSTSLSRSRSDCSSSKPPASNTFEPPNRLPTASLSAPRNSGWSSAMTNRYDVGEFKIGSSEKLCVCLLTQYTLQQRLLCIVSRLQTARKPLLHCDYRPIAKNNNVNSHSTTAMPAVHIAKARKVSRNTIPAHPLREALGGRR